MIRENFQKSDHAQGNFSYLGMRRENFLTLKQPNLGNFCSQYSCRSAILNEDHATQYMLKVLSFRYCVINSKHFVGVDDDRPESSDFADSDVEEEKSPSRKNKTKTASANPRPLSKCPVEGCSFSKRNDKVKQHYRSFVLWRNQTGLPLGQKANRYLEEASTMVQNHTDHARQKGATVIKICPMKNDAPLDPLIKRFIGQGSAGRNVKALKLCTM